MNFVQKGFVNEIFLVITIGFTKVRLSPFSQPISIKLTVRDFSLNLQIGLMQFFTDELQLARIILAT